MRIRPDTKDITPAEPPERDRDMDYDHFIEALEELTPPTDSIMREIASGRKVFAPRLAR